MSGDSKPFCEGCAMGKQHRCPYPKGISYRAKEPFELIHSDVCGPMSESSIGGFTVNRNRMVWKVGGVSAYVFDLRLQGSRVK